jgi:hypothetical protein
MNFDVRNHEVLPHWTAEVNKNVPNGRYHQRATLAGRRALQGTD